MNLDSPSHGARPAGIPSFGRMVGLVRLHGMGSALDQQAKGYQTGFCLCAWPSVICVAQRQRHLCMSAGCASSLCWAVPRESVPRCCSTQRAQFRPRVQGPAVRICTAGALWQTRSMYLSCTRWVCLITDTIRMAHLDKTPVEYHECTHVDSIHGRVT